VSTFYHKKFPANAKEAIEQQLKAFKKKFGREPRPNEPVFFDPNHPGPDPVQLDEQKFTREALAAMKKAGTPPEIIFAYQRTGRILSEAQRDQYDQEIVDEWDAAIGEYYAGQAGNADFVQNELDLGFAFAGETVGEMTFDILGLQQKRRFKFEWQHTPEREHYDKNQQLCGRVTDGERTARCAHSFGSIRQTLNMYPSSI